MQEKFFTSKEASEITGCTLRQLQYWREKKVVVPIISETGTGRSVYYSKSDLVQLAAMQYCLSVGLSFEVARDMLKALKEQESEFANPESTRRFMLGLASNERSPELVEFDLERAIRLLKEGQPVIPVWLDKIHQQIANRLAGK